MVPSQFALLPARIFLANRRWVEGKALRIVNGRISSVVDPTHLDRKQGIIELPGVALLPGLINAHTHLEYTDTSFSKPGHPGFVAWLAAITSWKGKRSGPDVHRSLKLGVRECLKTGVVAVGDHYSVALIPWELIRSPLKGVVFHELLGLKPADAPTVLALVKRRGARFPRAGVRFGLALHTPFSLGQNLLTEGLDWAKSQGIPLSMHVGESKEEGELFKNSNSKLCHWLRAKTGVSFCPSNKDLFAHLERQGLWSVSLQAVHMNLARRRHLRWLDPRRLTIAYCPKSHEYFRHPRFALELFLGKGYCVALGTDSLASNDSLNMWEELRLAKSHHPSVPLEILWDMATVNGARSLGLPTCGQIRPGNWADLLGIPITRTRYPLAEVFRHKGDVTFCMIDGKVVAGAINARTRQASSKLLR